MPKAKRYTSEQIEKARKKLRGLSTKKVGKSRAEVAALLAGEIRKAVAQGYSLKEIRDVLAQAGVSIPLARLQAVLDGEGGKGGIPSGGDHESGTEANEESRPVTPQTGSVSEIPTKEDWNDEL